MLQVGSVEYRLTWSLTLGCVLGLHWDQHSWNQEERNRTGEREKSSWDAAQMTWADPMGVLDEGGPSGFPDMSSGQAFMPPPDGSLHVCGLQKGWWFKAAHWQHFQQLDNKPLKEGLNGTCPCLPPMCHSCRGRWLRCMYCGGMLLVTDVSQND